MNDYKFKPDNELVEFAKWFSDTYRTLDCGVYNRGNYNINYVNINANTVARVGSLSHSVEFNYNKLCADQLYTSDFIFFLVLWVHCEVELLKRGITENIEIQTDQYTLEYYLTTGRSRKMLLIGLKHQFEFTATELNTERYKIMKKSV